MAGVIELYCCQGGCGRHYPAHLIFLCCRYRLCFECHDAHRYAAHGQRDPRPQLLH